MVAAALIVPSVARAQEIERFQRGQWGAEFGLSYAYASLGVLRFTSPTRAWVADVSTSYYWRHESYSDTVIHSSGTADYTSAMLRLGRRGFKPMGTRVYRTLTGGILGTFNAERYSSSGSPVQIQWGAGVFAELGAQWMVATHLSLGAVWGVSARYTTRTSRTTFVRQRSTSAELQLGNLGLRGAFYF